MTTQYQIQKGFPKELRKEAAILFFAAFEQKLGKVLGKGEVGAGFIETVIDPGFCYSAISTDSTKPQLLGIAGFKTSNGSLVGGGFKDLQKYYGIFGACWRALPLSLFERDLKENVLLMDGIAVAEEARGLGIGTKLLDAIIKHADDNKCEEVRLDVINTNPRAKALYERKGFIAGKEQYLGPLKYLFGFSSATTMTRPV